MFATPEIISRDNEYFNLNVPDETEVLLTALVKFKHACENKWNLAFPRTSDKLEDLLAAGRTFELADILARDLGEPDTPNPLTRLLILEEVGGIDLDIALGLLSQYPAKLLTIRNSLAALSNGLTERNAVCWFEGTSATELPATLEILLAREGSNVGLVPAGADLVLLLRQERQWYCEFVSGSDLDARDLALRHSGLTFADFVRLGRLNAQSDMGLRWKALTVNQARDISGLGTNLVLYLAAILCGAIKMHVERSFKYARSRQSFDKPLIQHQAVAMRLADMLTASDVCRLALDRCGRELAQGTFDTEMLARLVFLLGEAVPSITRDAIQVHGGHGYVEEMPLAKGYRDCRTLMSHLQFMSNLVMVAHD